MARRGPQTRNNWRLERIASAICACVLTDGFCGPRNKPDCGCWTAARAAMQGMMAQANPVFADVARKLGEAKFAIAPEHARIVFDECCRAILTREDELTAEQAAAKAGAAG